MALANPMTALLGGSEAPRGARSVARDLFIGAGTVVLCALALVDQGVGASGLIAAGFLAVLVVLSVIDIERRILPNRIIFPATAVILAARLAFFPHQWLDWIVAPLGAAAFFLLLHAVQPKGIGMGDIKLMLLLVVGLGKVVAVGVLLGAFASGAFGVYLLVRHGSAARKMAIPFGPFLAFGAAVALFLADPSLL